MQFSEKEKKYREFLTAKVNPIIEPLTRELLKQQPENIHEFIINFVKKHKDDPNSVISPSPFIAGKSSPLQSSRKMPSSSSQPTNQKAQDLPTESDEEDDEGTEDFIPISEIQQKKGNQRSSVSAEVYGKFHQKGDYKPRVIKKSEEQKGRIAERLSKTFMFASLDPKEQEIIIDSMEEKKVKAGEWIIKQGDDGDNLYVIDRGTLECYKQFSATSEPKHVKTYNPGESFGELALLYNAPRAASIKAATDVIVFALDRDTFNHIVKDAIVKRKERFETILSKIELLDTMDPYERSKISDVALPVQYKAGETVIKQGEPGDKFYFIEEGEAMATKFLPGRQEAEVVYNYGPGDYFGELALLKGEVRAANIIAKTNLKLLALDRVTFDRVLGPLNDIIKRNMKRYEKYM